MPLYAALLVASLSAAWGQERLRVLDAATEEPVASATVLFRALGGGDAGKTLTRRSDARGLVAIPFGGRVAAAISHVGYTTIIDTISGGGERMMTFRLHAKSLMEEPVVVTGQATPVSSDRSLAAVRVIDRTQIASRSAQTLRDLLVGEAGISLSNDQILGTSVSLQGLSGQNVKILVDGVPVVGRLNGSIDLTQVPLANADRVEIIEGPMSVLYGTDALGGVINIITAKRTRGSFSATTHAFYESVGNYTADTRVGMFAGDTRIWLAGGRTLFTGFANPDTSRSKRWKPREQSTMDLDVTQFLGAHTIGLSGRFLNDYILNRGEPRSPYRETAFDDTYRTQRLTGRLLAQGAFGDNPYELSVAYSGYVRYKNSFLKNLVTLETTPTSAIGENDTSSDNEWNVRGRVSGILPFASDSVKWDVGGEATMESITGARIEDRGQHLGDYAIYGRLEYSPTPYLTVQPGLRATYDTRYPAPLVPSLQVKIAPDSAIAIRASYGRGFRAPSLQELHFSFVDINHDIHGNPDLHAETSHNINASVNYTNRSVASLFEAGVSGYYNSVRNLITLISDSNDVYSYGNIGDVRTIGGSVSSTMRWQKSMVRASVGITGTSSAIEDRGAAPLFIIAPELGAEARWQIFSDVELAADYKYTASVPHYARATSGEIEHRLSDDYHLLNASVAYTFLGERATIRAGVHNIANVTDISLGVAAQSSPHGGDGTTVPITWGRSFILDLQLRVP